MKTVNIDVYFGANRMRLALSGDFNSGEVIRDEGSVPMQLRDPVFSVECEGIDFSSIHTDILGLIGVLAFYPALPRTEPFVLRFGFPVSPLLEQALRRPWILEQVTILTSDSVGPYTPQIDTVISYGGGIDSLAASIMFPEVPLVHESPLPTRNAMFHDVVNDLILRNSSPNKVVYDNLRQLFTAWGLPVWVSVFIASLIVQPSNIISGSEMTGTYLLGGTRYAPRFSNLWYTVFNVVGVRILPTSFLSEVGNARIAAYYARLDDAAYCTRISRKDCDNCTKCLRRRMIRGALDPDALRMVDDFDVSPSILDFLDARPLYYGDVFLHTAAIHMRPTWVSERLSDLVERHGKLGFHEKYNQDTFEHFKFPEHLRSMAESTMHSVGLEKFDQADRAQFTKFQQVPQ